MDSLIGFVGADYVLLAADSSQARSILMMKTDEDKILVLDDHKLLAAAGEQGDKVQFTEYIQRNIALYNLRTGTPLSTKAVAHYTRGELATALRSNPYSVNMLLGGFDADQGPSLYFLDYLASLHKMDFACQGYAGYFLMGLFDKYYKKGMTLDEGLKLLQLCIDQLKTRFIINNINFAVKIVTKDGVKVINKA
jgi:20S proteasome subunit beta 4